MSILPDTKDWTWVLDRPCPDCGVDTRLIAPPSVAGMIRANAAAWAARLEQPADALRPRPAPGVWSPLEYAAGAGPAGTAAGVLCSLRAHRHARSPHSS